ncbi:MAG: ATP-binding protein [Pseudomonadota bacterium]
MDKLPQHARLSRRTLYRALPIVALFLLMLAALVLLSDITSNSERFEGHYLRLLGVNILGLIVLAVLIGVYIARLFRDLRAEVIGSRLALRLVTLSILIAVVPATILYYFSLQFLQRGIDSWFDVRVEQSLQDALDLARGSLDLRVKELMQETQRQGLVLVHVSDAMVPVYLNELRQSGDLAEVTLLSARGRLIASSAREGAGLLPSLPDEAILYQVRQGYHYVGLDPIGDELYIHVATLVPAATPFSEQRILRVLYPLPRKINALLDNVNNAFASYKKLVYLRTPMKNSFIVTLSLVLLLALFTAVWVALFAAQRLVEPIRVLATGTRSVATGDYTQKLPLPSDEDFGSLVHSFNEMTGRLAQARDEAESSRQQAERERAYLKAVLGGLSSGVLTLDRVFMIRTVNSVAQQLLEVDFDGLMGTPLKALGLRSAHVREFVGQVLDHFNQHGEWQDQITVFGPSGRRVLMCRGATLSSRRTEVSGFVLVLDDVTALIQAQRDAAWSEVARRLAHEIKNPLTPIQLAAERLQRKYLGTMAPEDAEVLERSTNTIIHQVQAMEEMVKAFAEYAYAPKLQLVEIDLNHLIGEVIELYRNNRMAAAILQQGGHEVIRMPLDAGRIRQLLHNLVKNALEAIGGKPEGRVVLSTQISHSRQGPHVELRVEDNGPGIAEAVFGQLFDPYVSTKPKGTGLGLAIVKKIVEEHNGVVWAENLPAGGAAIVIRLPIQDAMKGDEHADAADASRKSDE